MFIFGRHDSRGLAEQIIYQVVIEKQTALEFRVSYPCYYFIGKNFIGDSDENFWFDENFPR